MLDERQQRRVIERVFSANAQTTSVNAFRLLETLQDQEPALQLMALAMAYRAYCDALVFDIRAPIHVAQRMHAALYERDENTLDALKRYVIDEVRQKLGAA